ncbi:MAG: c-type cytochrome domain-containing protein [Planctomycetaceae bacterium]
MKTELAITIICAMAVSPVAADNDVNKRGVAFLETHCASCHGDDNAYPGLDVRDRETLLKPTIDGQAPYLVPGDLQKSRLWQVSKNHLPKQMPPDYMDQPTEQDFKDLRKWIESGAEFPKTERPRRKFLGEKTIAEIVLEDLRKQQKNRQRHTRYFSLLHLWNDPLVPDRELRLTRAAVSKLINSFSSQARITVPKQIDEDGLVLRIDLRDYGWTQQHHWLPLLNSYPYGLLAKGETADRLYDTTGCQIPYVRADWFVHTATRPALYHRLVTLPDFQGIPERVGTLERLLGVNLQTNFDTDRLWRAGFSGKKSGVSDHNRIVERHDARYGYYWPSYDSAGDQGRQNFSRFPLGPKFPNRENLAAFDHDGGEFIFSLPNGMQAYMLATADGKRINIGPDEIVRDLNQHAGTFRIVNGISCMGCHQHGMVRFEDTIRPQWEDRTGDTADKVRRLYPNKETMNRLVDADEAQFMRAFSEACGEFLKQGEDASKDIKSFPEPITTVSKKYDHELFLTDVARELGLPDVQADADAAGIGATASDLRTIIKFNKSLRRSELFPLTVNEPITRKQWESAFHEVSHELGVGRVVQQERLKKDGSVPGLSLSPVVNLERRRRAAELVREMQQMPLSRFVNVTAFRSSVDYVYLSELEQSDALRYSRLNDLALSFALLGEVDNALDSAPREFIDGSGSSVVNPVRFAVLGILEQSAPDNPAVKKAVASELAAITNRPGVRAARLSYERGRRDTFREHGPRRLDKLRTLALVEKTDAYILAGTFQRQLAAFPGTFSAELLRNTNKVNLTGDEQWILNQVDSGKVTTTELKSKLGDRGRTVQGSDTVGLCVYLGLIRADGEFREVFDSATPGAILHGVQAFLDLGKAAEAEAVLRQCANLSEGTQDAADCYFSPHRYPRSLVASPSNVRGREGNPIDFHHVLGRLGLEDEARATNNGLVSFDYIFGLLADTEDD